MRNRYISQSAIKDFISCSKKYYYRVNFSEEAEKTIEMNIGLAVHEILEKYWHDSKEAVSNSDPILNKYGISDARNKNKVFFLIENYFDRFYHMVSEDDIIEKMFTVPYKDNIFLTGKFDRINPKTDLVIDWKTGSLYYNYSQDIQAIMYYTCYKTLFGKYPKVVYLSLKDSNMKIYTPDNLYIDMLYTEILPDMINAINSNSFVHTGFFNNSCRYCSFKNLCHKELGVKNDN